MRVHGRNLGESCAVALVVLACGWLYAWNAGPASALTPKSEPGDFYGYQTAGFLSGRLSTSNPPNPALLALSNPYDPVANAPYRVHDMTLWKGKYYLYFGATPVVLLLAPLRLLTGSYLGEPLAVVVFLTFGLAAGGVFLVTVRSIYFSSAPRWVTVLSVALLGLASPVMLLTTHAQVYQVPIACAYCLHLLALVASVHALRSQRAAILWLAGAGACVGLALGARPNTLAATPWLLVPLLVCVRRVAGSGPLFGRPLAIATFAAYGPVALAGSALLLLNWLRFGSASEFGATYQLAGANQLALAIFSPGRIAVNAPEYLFNAGTWQPYFPFLVLPEGRPWGVALYLPWIWLGLWSLIPRRGSSALTLVLAIGAMANFFLISSYFATVERYLCDFTPALLLLGSLGALALAFQPSRRRLAIVAVFGGTTLLSGFLIFAQRAASQEKIRPLAQELNRASALWDRLLNREHGVLRLEIELPPAPTLGASEPLVESGRQADQRDWLQITYQSADVVSFEFFHAGFGLIKGGRINVPLDRRLVVEVRSGGLLPPITHPLFAGWNADDHRRERDQLWVSVNGVDCLRGTLACYPAGPGDVFIGQHRNAGHLPGERFTGQILRTTRLPFSPAAEPRPSTPPPPGTALALQLVFPAGRTNGAEPLLATGAGTASDLLYCEFVGPNQIRIGLDHFGYGGLTSKIIDIDPTRTHELIIWMGSLSGPTTPASWNRRLLVRLDGRTLIDGIQDFYPARPSSAVIGRNLHGASTADSQFNGRLLSVRSVAIETL